MIAYSALALFAGLFFSYSFAPAQLWIAAFISPAILLWLWENSSKHRALLYGWLFGLAFFGFGVYWTFISIHEFGEAGIILAGLISGLFIITLALFPALQGFAIKAIPIKHPRIKRYLLFPATWGLLEWIRSWLFTGFPWLLLGTAQLDGPLAGLIPLLGVYGISFITALISASLLELKTIRLSWVPVLLFPLCVLLSWGGKHISWSKPRGNPLRFSLIQGNIPQRLKWDPDSILNTINTYTELTNRVWTSDVIVWPESAIPALNVQVQDFLLNLDQAARDHDSTLITGIVIKEEEKYYNGLLMLGTHNGHYYKRHLVPFGEYMPFAEWLKPMIELFDLPFSQLSAGSDNQAILTVNGLSLAPFICYEIAYPQLVQKTAGKGNGLLVLTDDAWFGRSPAQAQHLAIARMRAIENARPVVFASNNGITSIISPKGEIEAELEPYSRGTLTYDLQLVSGYTPLAYYGHGGVIGAMFSMLIIALGFYERKNR